jgi:hypothetical protein
VNAAIRNEAATPKRPINEIFTAVISIQGSASGSLSGIFSMRGRKRESIQIITEE